ncbi:MAG TPA: 2OG-Fe(II) oxygenase [Kofleriaceae bacterium]|jgi:Rps23 Pro-64 3,4-dihydroxylase Tpa1-like proline 4-hydroxylase|nr:2OG-Fe(II) oxygenase [Kofleriaceae bacterium]
MNWLQHRIWADQHALQQTWRAATPFPHLIIDDLLSDHDLATLVEILDEEPVEFATTDIYAFDATAVVPATSAFAALREQFGASLAPTLSLLTSTTVQRADMRAYAYRPGHYLLPHTDYQPEQQRVLAYAYYLPTPDAPDGGELELYACALDSTSSNDALGPARLVQRIEPRPNRCVIFEVRPDSLHQVNEVLSGLRLSLAGWFYP